MSDEYLKGIFFELRAIEHYLPRIENRICSEIALDIKDRLHQIELLAKLMKESEDLTILYSQMKRDNLSDSTRKEGTD